MNCRICGLPKAGPEKLCGACAGALRRAREGSAALGKRPPFGANRVMEAVATVAGRPTVRTRSSRRGWRRQGAWAAVVLATIGIVYLGNRAADRTHGLDVAVATERSPMPWSERPRTPAAPVPARPETPPSTGGATIVQVPAPAAGPSLRTDRLDVTQGATPPAPTQAAGAKARTGPAMAAASLEPISRASPSPRTSPNDAAIGKSKAGTLPVAEAQQLLTQADAAQSDPPTDDAKVLARALDRCGKESFLAGFICEQKAYLRYCDGKWDQVPLCTRKAEGN